MKKISLKLSVFAVLVFICLALFTGCAENVDGGMGSVTLSDEYSASRGLALREELLVPTDDIYWAYTAEKLDGLYTKGGSKKSESGASTDGSDGLNAGGFVLRPVKSGPAAGLNGASVGPFATGDWEIKIYGYMNCAVESGKCVFKNLIYTGETSGSVRVVAGTVADVVFALTPCGTLPTGVLAFDTVSVTVPEDKHFYGLLTGTFYEDGVTPVPDTVVKARVFEGTTLVAQSVTTVTTDCPAGTSVTLNPFVFSTEDNNKFTAGEHNLVVAVEYQDKYTKERFDAYGAGSSDEPTYHYAGDDANFYEEGFAKVGDLHIYPITFEDGKRYVLFQDLNDLTAASETAGKTKALVPYEARILKSGSTTEYDYYKTFAEAVNDFSADSRPIVLLCDVDNAGTVSKSVTVDPNGQALRNLTVSGTSAVVTFKPSTSRVYTFKDNGAKLNLFSVSSTAVVIDSTGGSFTVNTTDNVVHAGSVANVTVTKSANTKASNLGYHIQADVTGELQIAEGFLDICGSAKIEKLNVTATSTGKVVLKGTTDNDVKKIYNGSVDLTNGSSGTTNKDTSGAYRTYTLNANGGGGTAGNVVYGIEGMYLTLPKITESGRTVISSPMFTAPSRANGSQVEFVLWNTAANSSGTAYCDGCKLTVGSSNVALYANWGSPVGGTVFYIDSSATYANYKFYKKSGKSFTAVSAPAVKTDGSDMYYVFTSTTLPTVANKDKYYVFNDDLIFVGGSFMSEKIMPFEGPAYNGRTLEILTGVSSTQTITMTDALKVVGKGRTNTDYIMHLGESGAPTGEAYKPEHFVQDSRTKWFYLKNFINDPKKMGCGDWYIPSLGELYQYQESGATSVARVSGSCTLMSSSLTDFYGSTYGKYCCQAVRAKNLTYASWWAWDGSTYSYAYGTNPCRTLPIRSF